MTKPQPKPAAPKVAATKVPATKTTHPDHEESLLDEGVDESFPASDPPSMASPGGSMAEKNLAERSRAKPRPEDELPALLRKPASRAKGRPH